MKMALVISTLLASQAVLAAQKVAIIQHETCQLATSVLNTEELAAKNFKAATFKIKMQNGSFADFPLQDTSDLVGPFTDRDKISKQSQLETTLNSLHVSKAPNMNFYNEKGEKLTLPVDQMRSHVISADIPQFPLDNAQKIYFELTMSVDKATIKKQDKMWAHLEKTPVYEKTVFRSKVFSFSEVAANLIKNPNDSEDEVLKLIAKNDPKVFAELAKDPAEIESLNFVKLLLLEHVRIQAMGDDDAAAEKLNQEMKAAIPNCQIKK